MKKGMIAVGILCLMLSGCGKKKDVSDDFVDVQGDEGSISDNEDFDDNLSVVGITHVNYTVEGRETGVNLKVDADVDTVLPDNVQVYEVEKVHVSDDYLKQLASNVFDNGEYEILQLENSYSAAEQLAWLETMDTELAQIAKEHNKAYEVSPKYKRINFFLDEDDAGVVYDFEDGQVIYENVEEDMRKGLIQGKINDETFELYYCGQDLSANYGPYGFSEGICLYPVKGISFKAGCERLVSPEDVKVTENACDYHEAVVAAQDMVEKLGFVNYEMADSYVLMEDEEQTGVIIDGSLNNGMGGVSVPNGYRFAFTPNMDGRGIGYYHSTSIATLDYIDSTATLTNDSTATLINKDKISVQPSVVVDVDDTGIIRVYMEGMVDVKQSISSDTKLMSFEQADAIAKKTFEEIYTVNAQVSQLRLEYVVVKYENQYALVPAWVYYRQDYGGEAMTLFAINALDGTPIHFTYNFGSL